MFRKSFFAGREQSKTLTMLDGSRSYIVVSTFVVQMKQNPFSHDKAQIETIRRISAKSF